MHSELHRLLTSLEKPLRFAAKDRFANLEKVKDLDRLVRDIVLSCKTLGLDRHTTELLEMISESFNTYNSSQTLEKKETISSALTILDTIIRRLEKEEAKVGRIEDDSAKGQKGLSSTGSRQTSEKKRPKIVVTAPLSSIPLTDVPGIGPKISRAFNKKGIMSTEDLLYYFPRKYQDRQKLKKISEIMPSNLSGDLSGKVETVKGEIILSGTQRLKTRTIFKAVLSDGSGSINLIWFQARNKYLKTLYKKGARLILSGEVVYDSYTKSLQIVHPKPENVEFLAGDEELEPERFAQKVPIYPLIEGIGQRRLREIMKTVVESYAPYLNDFIPEETKAARGLLGVPNALKSVHFPPQDEPLVNLEEHSEVYESKPHRTLAFCDFFLLELGLALKKRNAAGKPGFAFTPTGEITGKLLSNLQFELTSAQERVIAEIERDMRSETPMNRLLQGDVGSGKTIVALITMLKAVECGFQVAIMAPTEILAEQHYRSISHYLDGMGIVTVLLKSGIKKKEKTAIKDQITLGDAQIVVGTHAVIEEDVVFDKLGLVVIDEQHRFGVLQRARLITKGTCPDVLVMTATPIPRTLALTVYGDLDVSVIDELPHGRRPVQTWVVYDRDETRRKAYDFIKGELDKGRQVFFVYPLIEESENPDFNQLKQAVSMAEELAAGELQSYKVGLLHGRMKQAEKDLVMRGFVSGEVDVLVSTTVIEVGVDIPNATVMVVENAERFGLSQLHQLRGRIGRSTHESHCILIASERLSEVSIKRLEIMKRTTDGFKIAEEDLNIRGPGDFLGTKQSGLPEFRFAKLLRDSRVLGEAREEAFRLVESDPELMSYPSLREEVIKSWGENLVLAVA